MQSLEKPKKGIDLGVIKRTRNLLPSRSALPLIYKYDLNMSRCLNDMGKGPSGLNPSVQVVPEAQLLIKSAGHLMRDPADSLGEQGGNLLQAGKIQQLR